MVGSDDGHTGKSAITTPQSASLTAPLTQGSPCRVPHRHRSPLPNQPDKFLFPRMPRCVNIFLNKKLIFLSGTFPRTVFTFRGFYVKIPIIPFYCFPKSIFFQVS